MKHAAFAAFTTLVATLGLAAASADASVIVVFDSVAPNPSGPGFVWKYSASLQPSFDMRQTSGIVATPSDFFTVFDVAGLDTSSVLFTPAAAFVPANGFAFTAITPLVGHTAPKTAPPDNALIPNITVALTLAPGGQIVSPATTSVLLGELSFVSSLAGVPNSFTGYFGSQTEKASNSTTFGTTGRLPLPVPEPSAAVLPLAGLAAFLRRARRA